MECMDGLSMMVASLGSLGTSSLFSPNTLAECSMALALRDAMLDVRRSSLLGWGCCMGGGGADGQPRIGLEPRDEEDVDEDEPRPG